MGGIVGEQEKHLHLHVKFGWMHGGVEGRMGW